MRSALFIISAVVMVAASPLLALIAQPKPQMGEVALVIAAPFGPPLDAILMQADLSEVYPTRAPMGAFVHLETQHSYDRLLAKGAWLVVAGKGILSLC